MSQTEPVNVVVGPAATLCWWPTSTDTAALLKLWECFLSRNPPLTWFVESKREKYRPWKSEFKHLPATLVRVPKEMTFWKASCGVRHIDASIPSFHVEVFRSGVEPAHPVEDLDYAAWSDLELSNVKADALDLARSFTLRYGLVGLAGVPPIEVGRHYDAIAPTMKATLWRYQGLFHAGHAADTTATDGICGTNWMTFVCNALLDKVGGKDALRRRLSNEIEFHEIKDGWAIQAGPEPQIGDVNADEDALPLYREVARALAPIRQKLRLGYQWFKWRTLIDETEEWRARLERPLGTAT